MNKEVLRLAGLLAAIALATSRVGLVLHELVAHGGVALLCGARVVHVEMFWFAGGWIRYVLPEPSLPATLAIAMAGIALEILIGSTLCLVFRGESLGRRLLRGVGAALVLHATWYLAAGAFHGFGDGFILHRELGAARVPFAIAAGLVTCATAYLGGRAVFGALYGVLPGSRRARIAGLVIAMALGAGLHAALTIGELRLRRDEAYIKMMRPERERRIDHEFAEWQRQQAERGVEPTPEARRVQRVQLERKHKSFPFVVLLAIASAAAGIAGAVRSRPGPDVRIPGWLLARAVVFGAAAIWCVIVIDGLFPR